MWKGLISVNYIILNTGHVCIEKHPHGPLELLHCAYMSWSSSVWTLAAYKSSSSLEIRTLSPSVKSSLVTTQLGTAYGKSEQHQIWHFTTGCLKHSHKVSSCISDLLGFCRCMRGCCPPLLRSCCHPSGSPHRPRSSPAADSRLVPSAEKRNRRGAQENKWMQE